MRTSKSKTRIFLLPLGSPIIGPVFRLTRTPELRWSPEKRCRTATEARKQRQLMCWNQLKDQEQKADLNKQVPKSRYVWVSAVVPTAWSPHLLALEAGSKWFTETKTGSTKQLGEKVTAFWVLSPLPDRLSEKDSDGCYLPNTSLQLHNLHFNQEKVGSRLR